MNQMNNTRAKGKRSAVFCHSYDIFCHYGIVIPPHLVCQFLGTTIDGIQNEAHNLQILPCSVCPLEDNNIKGYRL